MASRVSNRQSAGEVVWEYLALHHPELSRCDLSVIALGPGWLVQAEGGAGARLLLMVNRFGFVEEMGRAKVTPKTAGTGDSALPRRAAGAVDIDLTGPVHL